MGKQQLVLRFENLSAREAALAAQDLQNVLTEAAPGIEVAIQRDRAEAQDLGATLVLVLGTPAIIAVAKGIAGFIGKRGERSGTLVIERKGPDGRVERVVFEGASADAAKLAETLRSPVSGS
jgi:hypothetical protein